MIRAVLHFRASPGLTERLKAAESDWLSITVVDEANDASFAEAMQVADVLLHVLGPVTAEVIANAPKLKLIQKIGVGVNTIDLKAAEQHGVAVTNMPGTNSRAVAEMALTLMLAALRSTTYFDAITRRGEGWCPAPHVFDRAGEIGGRTVGLAAWVPFRRPWLQCSLHWAPTCSTRRVQRRVARLGVSFLWTS